MVEPERRSHSNERGAPWPWWKRYWVKFWIGFHKVLIHPFLTVDGYGSMPAWVCAALTWLMIDRLRAHTMANGSVLIIPAGWPDAIMLAVAVLGVPLYEAAAKLVVTDPKALIDAVMSRFGIGDVASSGAMYQYAIDTERAAVRLPPDPI